MTDNTLKLLLIDDDEQLTQVMARAFHRRGFHCEQAHTPEHALQLIKTHPFSHCLLDLKIAQHSGLPLIPELLKHQAELKIVMLTGYSSINTAVDAIKLGAINYLCKPADADDVIAAFNDSEASTKTEIKAQPPSLNRLEWEYIQKVLGENDGNVSATARALGMHRRTLQRKLQKHPVKQ